MLGDMRLCFAFPQGEAAGLTDKARASADAPTGGHGFFDHNMGM